MTRCCVVDPFFVVIFEVGTQTFLIAECGIEYDLAQAVRTVRKHLQMIVTKLLCGHQRMDDHKDLSIPVASRKNVPFF